MTSGRPFLLPKGAFCRAKNRPEIVLNTALFQDDFQDDFMMIFQDDFRTIF